MERVHLAEKHRVQVTFPAEHLPRGSEQLSSVRGHPCTPGPRAHWGWRRPACPFWSGIPRLAGSRGCWSRSSQSQSCEESAAGCKRSNRLWEGLSPLVLRAPENRRQQRARGGTGQSHRASWSWQRRDSPGAWTAAPKSFRTLLCPVLILSWEPLFIETLRPGTEDTSRR